MGRNLFPNDQQTLNTPRTGRNLFANDQPEEDRSFLSKLPGNIATGAFHAGRRAHNLPHDIAESFESSTGGLSDMINKELPVAPRNGPPISSYLPYDTQDYSDLFGAQGNNTFADKAIQKGIEYAPELLAGANALRNIISHLTRRGASKSLRAAKDMGINRNMGALDINPELIEDLRQYLPNTLPYRNLIEKAKTSKNNVFSTYYHGHHEPLTEFADETKLYPDSEFGKGFWTSTNKEVAQDYGKNLHEVKGDYKVFDVNSSHDKELLDLYKNVQEKKLFHEGKKKTARFPSEKEIQEANEAVKKFREAVKSKGYEGIQRLEYPSNEPEVMFFEKPSSSAPKAKTNNYQDLFNLQSDVGKHSAEYARDLFSSANRAHGKEGFQARNRLLDAIHEDLNQKGHEDISNLLRKGQNEYRRYIKFKPYRNMLAMGAAAYALPKNALTNLVKKMILHKND